MILDAVHIDKEGARLRIAEMDTQHLLNTIRFQLRKLEKVVAASETKQDDYTAKLYNYRQIDINEAVEAVEMTIALLTPYIFEAFYRFPEVNITTMEEIQQLLNTILRREGRLITPAGLLPERASSQEMLFLGEDDDEQFGDGHPHEFGDS